MAMRSVDHPQRSMVGGAGDAHHAPGRNAVSASGNTSLNPYSCLLCRKKKKKCDRIHPCQNCRRIGAECFFTPRRPSTRHKVPESPMERLRHLEHVIGRLRADLEVESSRRLADDEEITGRLASDMPTVSTTHEQNCVDEDEAADLEMKLGRLAIGDGTSRYVVSSFWATLDEEVEDLKSLLKEAPDKAKECNPSAMPYDIGKSNQAYIFGIGSAHTTLFSQHPAPDKIPLYWSLFKENCDLLIKVLHVPTVEPLIMQAAKQLDRISKGLEPLMFSIYFSVVSSLSAGECLQILGGEKDDLLRTYKYSMEQALARADFLETEEMIVLQAFIIFLVGLRRHCSIRLMWTLTALAVRLAQNAGIHRDGTHFNLPPFVVEMRRRLWWSICILDSRACEDSGYDAAILHEGVDTQMPLNVNDSDLFPSMTTFPKPRIGTTDMTFSLVRFEAIKTFRRLRSASAGTVGKCGKFHASKSFAEKSEWISKCQERLEELCLKHCDLSDPFSWYTAAVSRILSAKMWLVAHHPYLRRNSCAGLPQDTKDHLFATSIQTVEYWLVLNTETRTRKWRWLCETYIQWYALTLLLSELCIRTQGEEVDRAWSAVNEALKLGWRLSPAFSQTEAAEPGQHCYIPDETHVDGFKPLSRLLTKARSARAHALSLEESWIGIEAGEGQMIPTLDDSFDGQTFCAEDVNQPNIGFDDIAFDLTFTPGTFAFPDQSLDNLQSFQGLPYNDDMYPLSYPHIDQETSTWRQWQVFPEE